MGPLPALVEAFHTSVTVVDVLSGSSMRTGTVGVK